MQLAARSTSPLSATVPVDAARSGELFAPELVAVGIDQFNFETIGPYVLEEAAGRAPARGPVSP